MPIRQLNEGVFETTGSIVNVDNECIDQLVLAAPLTKRKRARICAHKSNDDQVHEMLIALCASSYVCPHKHIDKSESYHLIRGEADVLIFEDDGRINQRIPLGEASSGKAFYARIDRPLYHCIFVWSDVVVIQETTNGPFDRSQTVVAPWAPKEDDLEAGLAYYSELREKLEAS